MNAATILTKVKRHKQAGMAVVAALVVVAVASVSATAILERQSLLAETLAGERDRTQARWLLRGGLDWARVLLYNDARSNAVTRLDAIWAQPISGMEISTPGNSHKAYFSGQIEDEQGKYNLWQLAANGALRPSEVLVLERLLSTLGLPGNVAIAIGQRIAASQSVGAEAYAPGLRAASDLLGIEGVSIQTAAALSAYVSVIPEKADINVNTASAEVLSAVIPGLDLAAARQLVDDRDGGRWITNRADFANRLGDVRLAPGAPLSVRSDWFKVTGEVTLDNAGSGMQALLRRQGDSPPDILWIVE